MSISDESMEMMCFESEESRPQTPEIEQESTNITRRFRINNALIMTGEELREIRLLKGREAAKKYRRKKKTCNIVFIHSLDLQGLEDKIKELEKEKEEMMVTIQELKEQFCSEL